MAKVSVIIPVYNVEAYLATCLDSVIHQTFDDMEIVCVNDASSDNSLGILQRYEKLDKRIQVVDSAKNGGSSVARNIGLNKATGDYVCFVDADDWIAFDYIEKMAEAMDETGVDMLVNTTIKHVKNGIEYPHVKPYNGQNTDKKYWDAKQAMMEIYSVVCSKIFKRSFIETHELRFPEKVIHEDFYFQAVSFANLDKFYTIDGPAYYYLDRPNSIMNTLVDDDLNMIKVYNCVFDYLGSRNKLSEKNKLFYIMPSFKISDERRYEVYKTFFEKIKPYFMQNKQIYNDMESFFITSLLSTTSFEEYRSRFPASVAISYLRRKK